MKTKLALSAIVAAVAVFSQGAFAQSQSPTRAEVKAEAKSGAIAPAGQGPDVAGPIASAGSDKTRAQRKAKTKMAREEGKLVPAGQGPSVAGPIASAGSDKTRMQRKDATKAARKAGTLEPAGQSPEPIADPAKK